jgi:phage gp37-like protein
LTIEAIVGYAEVESAIVTALKDGTETPFKTVEAYGSQLSDAELADELQRLVTVAPAALVLYTGSDSNLGRAGDLKEEATFAVAVIAAARSRGALAAGDEKSVGFYNLLDYVRAALHNNMLDGLNNPLLYAGNRRIALPGSLLTVAAYQVLFRVDFHHADGPVS